MAGEIDISATDLRGFPRIKKNKGLTTGDTEGHRVIPYLVFVLEFISGNL